MLKILQAGEKPVCPFKIDANDFESEEGKERVIDQMLAWVGVAKERRLVERSLLNCIEHSNLQVTCYYALWIINILAGLDYWKKFAPDHQLIVELNKITLSKSPYGTDQIAASAILRLSHTISVK
jgi:hypothetical protein